MAKVTYLYPQTAEDIPVSRVLHGALDCTDVLVLGWAEDGTFYAGSSTSDNAALLLLVETFKHALLSGDYNDAD